MANFPTLLRTLKTYRAEVIDLGTKAEKNVTQFFSQPEETKAARSRNLWQLVRLSCVVCGIEFCYAAETAFVSPILLKMGIPATFMTTVWAISPLLGFFLIPLVGSLSDRCSLAFGRRRPFIVAMSVGIFLGLLLVPNGRGFGEFLGDTYCYRKLFNQSNSVHHNVTTQSTNSSAPTPDKIGIETNLSEQNFHNPWGLFFTIIGVVLLDLNCDGCQSPSRTYMLDVCIPEDQNRGLTIFTILAGIGGSVGYILGAINWEKTHFGEHLGGHVRVVFMLVFIMYLICLTLTLTAVKEVPLKELGFAAEKLQKSKCVKSGKKYRKFINDDSFSDHDWENDVSYPKQIEYGSLNQSNTENDDNCSADKTPLEVFEVTEPGDVSLKTYLLSIIYMPNSMRFLCLTNLFCWSSLVCYSLNFTDFVGQAVYGGDPKAQEEQPSHILYEEGIRWGSLSMALYSASCSAYSMVIKKLVDKLGAKPVYICSQLVYTVGALVMAISQNQVAVLLLSSTAGIMYATLFTMPYFLVAHYHSTELFSETSSEKGHVRGLGTDVATVSSMVFVAQLGVSMTIGTLVHVSGTTAMVMYMAAVLSLLGALAACKVHYAGL